MQCRDTDCHHLHLNISPALVLDLVFRVEIALSVLPDRVMHRSIDYKNILFKNHDENANSVQRPIHR